MPVAQQTRDFAAQGTLEEAIEADLLLHVIDSAAPDVAHQRATVYRVLRELGVSDSRLRSRVVEVWNKADLLEAPDASAPAPSASQAAARSPEQPRESGILPSDLALDTKQFPMSDSVQMAGKGLEQSFPRESTGSVHLESPHTSADQHDAAASWQPYASAKKPAWRLTWCSPAQPLQSFQRMR